MNIDCIKNGHTDEAFDGFCDRCGADLVLDDMAYPGTGITGIFTIIKDFFERIISFIKSLLNI